MQNVPSKWKGNHVSTQKSIECMLCIATNKNYDVDLEYCYVLREMFLQTKQFLTNKIAVQNLFENSILGQHLLLDWLTQKVKQDLRRMNVSKLASFSMAFSYIVFASVHDFRDMQVQRSKKVPTRNLGGSWGDVATHLQSGPLTVVSGVGYSL